MTPRKRGSDAAAPPGAKKAAAPPAASPAPPPPQLFRGLVFYGNALQAEDNLARLVAARGGVLVTARTAAAAKARGRSATHVLRDDAKSVTEALAAQLRDALRAPDAPAPLLVAREWVASCVRAGELLQPEPFLIHVLSDAAAERTCVAAAAAASVAAVAARNAYGSDDETPGAEPAAGAFVPPPPDGSRCAGCASPLAWCELHTCQACLRARGGDTAVACSLHKRYVVDHPNKALVALLSELSDYEQLFPQRQGDTSRAVNFARQAMALKAAPADVATVQELARWELPYFGGATNKTRDNLVPEFLRTGAIERLQKFRRDPARAATRQLLRLPYIGRRNADAWAAQGYAPQDVWRNLSDAEKGALTHWQRLALRHAADLLEDIGTADRAPVVAALEAAAAAAADAYPEQPAVLTWQYGGGTARGKAGGHDLDFLFTADVEGAEIGKLEAMLTWLAASDAVERDSATNHALMAVVLTHGANGDASGDSVVVNARSFAAGDDTTWQPGQAFAERSEPATKAMMLIKLKGQPLRHVDVLMVPRSEHAFWVAGWVGSTQLRRLLATHARGLSLPRAAQQQGLTLRLNHRELRTAREGDDAYRGERVTKLGRLAPTVPRHRMQADYVEARMYPETEREVWDMLELPWRPFEDRNA